jgi:hypothetical protein
MAEYQHLYQPRLKLYILDTKQYGDFAEPPWDSFVIASRTPPPPLAEAEEGRPQIQVWQPLGRDINALDDWFAGIFYDSAPSFTNVDEVLGVLTRRGGEPPFHFTVMQTQGRSRHKTMAVNMQELAYCPDDILKQATHIVAFRLVGKQEPLMRNKLLRRENRHHPPRKRYGFSYLRMDDPLMEAIDYDGLEEFF